MRCRARRLSSCNREPRRSDPPQCIDCHATVTSPAATPTKGQAPAMACSTEIGWVTVRARFKPARGWFARHQTIPAAGGCTSPATARSGPAVKAPATSTRSAQIARRMRACATRFGTLLGPAAETRSLRRFQVREDTRCLCRWRCCRLLVSINRPALPQEARQPPAPARETAGV